MDSLQEQSRRDLEALRAQQTESAAWRNQQAEKFTQSFSASTAPQSNSMLPPRPNGQPYFTPGGAREAKEGLIAGIFAPVIACLYMTASRRLVAEGQPQGPGVYAKALGHALAMAWLWKTWAFTLFYWVVSGASIYFWMGSIARTGDPATGYTTGMDTSFQANLLVLHVLLLIPAIGVPYCQHVENSFFKKRALYIALSPINKILGWIPWFVLQTSVLLPLCFIIQYRW